jgi:hypothetical protein
MDSDVEIEKLKEVLNNLTLGKFIKALIFNVGYLFTMTILGALLVSLYGYYIPIDVTSIPSILAVAVIFTLFVVIDFGLLILDKPTPSIIAILLVVGGLYMIYNLLKNTDIHVEKNIPTKIKQYVPLRLING